MRFFANESVIEMSNFARLILASGENCPDMRYAAGFPTPDEFFYYEKDDVCGVICSALEFNRARSQARSGVTVRPESDFGGPDRIKIVSALAAELNVDGFLVPQDFPFGVAEKLRRAGIAVEPFEGIFFPEREFKTEDEIRQVTISQRAGEAGCRRAFEILRETDIGNDRMLYWNGEPLTSEILRAEIDIAMVRLGMLPTGTICAGGVQGSQPHNVGSGHIPADMPIVMDIFPRSATSGYWGDLTRTVVRGRASDPVKKAYDTVLTARESCKAAVCAGVNPVEVHNIAVNIMEKNGFYTGRGEKGDFGFFHGLGHGVGLDIHEAPRLSPRNSKPLKGGEIVTVEPGLYYPEWGGIRLEDLVVVTDGGCRCLTELEDFLEI